MKKEDYEKKYKKLSKAVEKFLRKYNWGKMEYLEEDNGIGIGFFNEEDEPQHHLKNNYLQSLHCVSFLLLSYYPFCSLAYLL